MTAGWALTPPGGGWQPIETAPKDAMILVWAPSYQDLQPMLSLCQWHTEAGFCIDELRQPTHWMPLPPPPETSHDRFSMTWEEYQRRIAEARAQERELRKQRDALVIALKYLGAEEWWECDGPDMQEALEKAGMIELGVATADGPDHEVGDEIYFSTALGRAVLHGEPK